MKSKNFKILTLILLASALLVFTGCNSKTGGSTDTLGTAVLGDTTTAGTTTTDDTITGTDTTDTTDDGPPPADEVCLIPAAVKQPLTLDQNQTKNVINIASVTLELGALLNGGRIYSDSQVEKSTNEPTASKLTSTIADKVKALQSGTASVKKTLDAVTPEQGENIACDSGTYSLQITDTSDEIEDGNKYMEKISLSFNECVLSKPGDKDELIYFFNDVLADTSIITNVTEGFTDILHVYTYNGSASLEYNNEYTYANSLIVPEDSSSSSIDKSSTHLITNALTIKYENAGVLAGSYASTEDMLFTFDFSSNSESNETGSSHNYQNSWSLTWEGSETLKSFGETNLTVNFNAICFAADGQWSSNGSNLNSDGSTESNSDQTTNSNGYIALELQDGEERLFLDSYSDALVATFVDDFTWTREDGAHNISETTLNGTVGSMLLGGSVAIDTQVPWMMSSDYYCDRSCDDFDPTTIRIRPGFYFTFTPYAGKTVLTGTNSAVIEFHLDDEDVTYGTIQVDDGEVVEYDSIHHMFYGGYIPI